MKNAGSTVQIDVDALAVGMYIHLDVGWMSHPFPLSSFRIGSEEQIGIIRSLGLRTVRWSPEQSALAEAEATATAVPATPPQRDVPAPPGGAVPTRADGAVPAPPDGAAQRRRAALAVERAALAVCEQQYAEATRDCRRVFDLAEAQPHAARDLACDLTRAFVDKMSVEGDLCIRVLTEAAGDKVSAHAVNVALVSLLMARAIGLPPHDLMDVGVGALLHDIGKLDLPPRVRHREDHFSAAEHRFYEEHVAHGVAQARTMGLAPGAMLVVAQHHEHADGSGFPLRLPGERMTPAACIVALVNRYDNLCNPLLPARALTPHEAVSLLFAQGRGRFEPAILGAFIKMMGVYPPGSVVQLTDGRHGVVVGVNSSRPLRPRVTVVDSGEDEPLLIDFESSPEVGIRRSLRPQTLPAPVQERLGLRTRLAYFFEPVSPRIET
jgi:putative nucleotidyltransferase with HDIG domain